MVFALQADGLFFIRNDGHLNLPKYGDIVTPIGSYSGENGHQKTKENLRVFRLILHFWGIGKIS